jgi:hypothetical protein
LPAHVACSPFGVKKLIKPGGRGAWRRNFAIKINGDIEIEFRFACDGATSRVRPEASEKLLADAVASG